MNWEIAVSRIFAWLQSVPDVIWSGVIASILTLSGVLISNWSNTSRLKIQLTHDSQEKEKERTIRLRKEVYLLAMEELINTSGQLATLPQMDLATDNIGLIFKAMFTSLSKVQLIGEAKTSQLALDLNRFFMENLPVIISLIIPLMKAKSNITINDGVFQENQKKINDVLQQMHQQHATGQANPLILEALQKQFDFFFEESQKYINEANQWRNTFNRENIEFQKMVVKLSGQVRMISIPLFNEMRRELGFQVLDESNVNGRDSEFDEAEKSFNATIESIKSHFPDVFENEAPHNSSH